MSDEKQNDALSLFTILILITIQTQPCEKSGDWFRRTVR